MRFFGNTIVPEGYPGMEYVEGQLNPDRKRPQVFEERETFTSWLVA